MRYIVEVKKQGTVVTTYTLEAADALSAINRVERRYGEPPQFSIITIEEESHRKYHVLQVSNWHGYTFEARTVDSDLSP